MLTNYQDLGMITVLRATTHRLTSADLFVLEGARDQMRRRGRSAMLVDLSGVRRVSRSGMAALSEFSASFQYGPQVGFFGARDKVAGVLAECPLTAQLPYFATQEEALTTAEFRRLRLAGMKAVVLCAGAGSRMLPVTEAAPKPMLDILGQPVIEHLLRYLQSFGVRDFVLNPGHHAPVIVDQMRSDVHRSLFFLKEGRDRSNVWCAEPLGSASTLARLHLRHNAFQDDFLVLCGDTLTDLDLAEMLERHRNSGAEVTIAARHVPDARTGKYGILDVDLNGRVRAFQEKPAAGTARTTLASTGIYIFSPRALDTLTHRSGQDIAQDLLPAILSRGGHIHTFAPTFNWRDIGCGRDYFDVLAAGLEGRIAAVSPDAQQLRPGLWVGPGATVSRRARICGPCYVGPGAVIEAGAQIDGPSVIGARAIVKSRSMIRRSVIAPDTHINSGAWIDEMLVHGDWAVMHRFADGSPQPSDRLEFVSHVSGAQTQAIQPAHPHPAQIQPASRPLERPPLELRASVS